MSDSDTLQILICCKSKDVCRRSHVPQGARAARALPCLNDEPDLEDPKERPACEALAHGS